MMLPRGLDDGFPVLGGGVPHRGGARRIVVVAARPTMNMATGRVLTGSQLELGKVAMSQHATGLPLGRLVASSLDFPACAPRAGGAFGPGAL